MKLSALDLLLVNADKLFAVTSLIGLSDLPVKLVWLFSYTVTTVSRPSC